MIIAVLVEATPAIMATFLNVAVAVWQQSSSSSRRRSRSRLSSSCCGRSSGSSSSSSSRSTSGIFRVAVVAVKSRS